MTSTISWPPAILDTMWPYLTKEPFGIASYGVMMAIGFLTGMWLFRRELLRRHIDPDLAELTTFLAMVLGIIGSKLAFLFTEAPSFTITDLLSGTGLTWHGGMILALVGVFAVYAFKRLPLLVMADAGAPVLATGYAFGRMGCLLSGDGDYGIPCADGNPDDFLCMAFPKGVVPSPCYADGIQYDICPSWIDDPIFFPVHPTPIYESVMNFALFGLLWAFRRKFRHPGVLFAIWAAVSGVCRFLIEFIRMTEGRPDRFLGLRDAQLVSIGQIVLAAVVLAFTLTRKVRPEIEYGIVKPVGDVAEVARP